MTSLSKSTSLTVRPATSDSRPPVSRSSRRKALSRPVDEAVALGASKECPQLYLSEDWDGLLRDDRRSHALQGGAVDFLRALEHRDQVRQRAIHELGVRGGGGLHQV